MTDPIDPLRPIAANRRRVVRRSADRGDGSDKAGLPMVIPASSAAAEPEPPIAAGFAAQVLGQGGQKRGLRGGPPVLEQARSAYLETEWSGPKNRRPGRGLLTKTDI